MDLQEEYFSRRKINGHLVRYAQQGHLILRAKDKKAEWAWLHVSLNWHGDGNHPNICQFQVAANPVIYASADFQHFTYHHTKQLRDDKFEWDQYEKGILDWAVANAPHYVAVPSNDAIFVSWSMFCQNYDHWMSDKFSWRMIDTLKHTLVGEKDARLDAIKQVEDWIHDHYERAWSSWRNIRNNLEQKNYADWLAKIINDMGEERKIVAYTADELHAAVKLMVQ